MSRASPAAERAEQPTDRPCVLARSPPGREGNHETRMPTQVPAAFPAESCFRQPDRRGEGGRESLGPAAPSPTAHARACSRRPPAKEAGIRKVAVTRAPYLNRSGIVAATRTAEGAGPATLPPALREGRPTTRA